MNTQDNAGFDPGRRKKVFLFGTIAVAISAALGVGCIGGGTSSDDQGGGITLEDHNDGGTGTVPTGASLYCDADQLANINDPANQSTTADTTESAGDQIPTYNVSKEAATADMVGSEFRANAGQSITRMSAVVAPATGYTDGIPNDVDVNSEEWTGEDLVHPVLVSYTEQVIGTYEMGDGSADIGDPYHIDDPFVSISLDNGQSWKKHQVGDSSKKSSIQVSWDNATIDYPGHSHKMTMNVNGNNILVAWLDKYCPAGKPDLENVLDETKTVEDDPLIISDSEFKDWYKVFGTQGTIDYGLDGTIDPSTNEPLLAPNGKEVYEVPFSCVWTARGTFDPDTRLIEWRQAEQLTSGTRDANKIWLASAKYVHDDSTVEGGFAITWQEDPEGLRSGKGAGPGVGWSGATTNHGADIWYTFINMTDFDDVCTNDDCSTTTDVPAEVALLTEKPKPAVQFEYPVRISDNAACSGSYDANGGLVTLSDTAAPYCTEVCTGSTVVESNNSQNGVIERCLTGDYDPLPQWNAEGELIYPTEENPLYAILDGDTGASRPAMSILSMSDENGDFAGFRTILGYEETKGLSDAVPGEPEQGEPVDIEKEGKVVYFESFDWQSPPYVSAGDIINGLVPRPLVADDGTITYPDENDLIYENARRLVLMNQVDSCEMTDTSYTFGILYKQSFETQGGASDMYIRMNTGLTYDTFVPTDEILNVSGMTTTAATASDADVDLLTWDETNMDDLTGENPWDNTFSPRGFLRGDEIYTGFAFTPSGARTESGSVASNFWIHRKVDDGDGSGLIWHGPQQVSFEQGGTSALDPRFIPTPKFANTGLESDKTNPSVLLMSYNTANDSHELDTFYSRSTDKGKTFEYHVTSVGPDGVEGTEDDLVRFHYLSKWPLPVEEGAIQMVGSPDGNMSFNVWLQHSAEEDGGLPDADGLGDGLDVEVNGEIVNIPDNVLGLEAWLGRVDWVEPEVAP